MSLEPVRLLELGQVFWILIRLSGTWLAFWNLVTILELCFAYVMATPVQVATCLFVSSEATAIHLVNC
jgi:hypothetical protein